MEAPKSSVQAVLQRYPVFADVLVTADQGPEYSLFLPQARRLEGSLLDRFPDNQPVKLLFLNNLVHSIPLQVFFRLEPVQFNNNPQFRHALEIVSHELSSEELPNDKVLEGAVSLLMLILLRDWKKQDGEAYDRCMEWLGNERLCRLMSYVEDHLTDELSFGRLSEKIYLSPDYVGQFFKRYSGLVLQQYIDRQRVLNGFKVMVLTSQRLSDIAIASGFIDQAYFNKRFKRQFHTTPLKVRKAYQHLFREGEVLVPKKELDKQPAVFAS